MESHIIVEPLYDQEHASNGNDSLETSNKSNGLNNPDSRLRDLRIELEALVEPAVTVSSFMYVYVYAH